LTNLQPTYGNFRVKGIVQGLGRTNALRTGETKAKGIPYKSISFNIQTNHDQQTGVKNIVPVSLFAMKYDEVTITPKDRDKKDRERIQWTDDVYDNIPEDWEVFMGTHVGLKQENGENVRQILTPYDAISEIQGELKDGDVVFISGRVSYSLYTPQNGETVTQQEFEIQRIYKSNDEMKFDNPEFEEVSSFDQTLIVVDKELDKPNKRLNVQARIVTNKDGQFVNYPLYVHLENQKALALNVHKNFTFGSEVKVKGVIHSTVEVQESAPVEVDEWGEAPAGYNGGNTVTSVVKELEITQADKASFTKDKYKQEDFEKQISEDPSPFDEKPSGGDEWGTGESSSSNDDPFGDDDPFK
jgi:hypothetical protein